MSFVRTGLSILLAGTAVLTASGAKAAEGMRYREHRSCVRAGGEATMITSGLAEFMAEAALKNSIKGMSAEPAGPIDLRCDDPAPLTPCRARQRACK